jgi:UDP:flavonoid glycosyltransferase YjiC (YdhE family)
MLVVPFAHDQPDNAARAERLGVARVIYPEQYSAKRVRLALQALLSDPDVRENAAAVSERVRAEDGAWSAATAISQLASHVPYSS